MGKKRIEKRSKVKPFIKVSLRDISLLHFISVEEGGGQRGMSNQQSTGY